MEQLPRGAQHCGFVSYPLWYKIAAMAGNWFWPGWQPVYFRCSAVIRTVVILPEISDLHQKINPLILMK